MKHKSLASKLTIATIIVNKLYLIVCLQFALALLNLLCKLISCGIQLKLMAAKLQHISKITGSKNRSEHDCCWVATVTT